MKLILVTCLVLLELVQSNPILNTNDSMTSMDSSSDMFTSNDSAEVPIDALAMVANMSVNMKVKSSIPMEPQRNCNMLSQQIIDEINSHQTAVNSIIDYVLKASYKGVTYHTMAKFVDTYGPRLTGSDILEQSINATLHTAMEDGFDEVFTENVTVPYWLRHNESAVMVSPRVHNLKMLGLGFSVGTPAEGIEAQIVLVKSFDQLTEMADQVPGKIVVFNQPYVNYFSSVKYRAKGAVEASKHGAVAVLIRSITDFSINSPHTGGQIYRDDVKKIPAACITVEDANMLERMYNESKEIRIKLIMGAENVGDVSSRNTIMDIKGTSRPEDIVVLSGHIDSWDIGAGAMDDAGGCFISYHANLLLKKLGLRARRTVRTLWFTGEEQGLFGGWAYFRKHQNEKERYQLILESDKGTFTPKGIEFTGSERATCIMEQILKLTAPLNTTQLVTPGSGPDIHMWKTIDVPIGGLYSDTSKYFWFHHSEGDTMDVEDPETLDRITALWAAVAYVVADISVDLGEPLAAVASNQTTQ